MSTPHWAPIRYRDFWDVPRIFVVEHEGHTFLFDCAFDEEAEDYPEKYHVYVMPHVDVDALRNSWDNLRRQAIQQLDDIPINKVRFDPTKRKAIDSALLDEMASRKLH